VGSLTTVVAVLRCHALCHTGKNGNKTSSPELSSSELLLDLNAMRAARRLLGRVPINGGGRTPCKSSG
jgi:hypothetical protein